jgi:uncharacterized phage protein (TIGR02216 family)
MSRFDWPGLMRAGLCGLRLPPEQFWSLTPAELRILLGAGSGAQRALSRQGLEALEAAFPDDTKVGTDDGSRRD